MTRFVALLLCVSCGSEPPDETTPPPPPPTACAIGDRVLEDGTCVPPGIPAEACAEGFASDGNGGCAAVLPAEACPSGTMAVPGETACREVAPCGRGTWGDIPIDGSSVHVDASYTGGTSNGSATNPYTTIAAAIAAAPEGAVVAVAEGVYAEDVTIVGKPVKLWGRCPGRVEIRGAGAAATIFVGSAIGTEIHDVAVTGPSSGIRVTSDGVHLERVWIHDTVGIGLNSYISTNVSARGLLIERARINGVYVHGSTVTFESGVVRDIQPDVSGADGSSMWIQDDVATAQRSNVTVRGVVLERSFDLGVFMGGSDALIEGLVVRDIFPRQNDQFGGQGLELIDDVDTGNRSIVTLRGATVERTHTEGLLIAGSDVVLEALVVRDTMPRATNQEFGRGIGIEPNPQSSAPSLVEIRQALIERNHEQGIYASFGEVHVASAWIRDTVPRASDQLGGRAVEVHDSPEGPATLSLRDSRLERSVDTGAFFGTHGSIDNVLVLETAETPINGFLGDGIVVVRGPAPFTPRVTIHRLHSKANQRAGLANFESHVEIQGSVFECNAFELSSDTTTAEAGLVDQGNNSCGCNTEIEACKFLSGALTPPQPL